MKNRIRILTGDEEGPNDKVSTFLKKTGMSFSEEMDCEEEYHQAKLDLAEDDDALLTEGKFVLTKKENERIEIVGDIDGGFLEENQEYWSADVIILPNKIKSALKPDLRKKLKKIIEEDKGFLEEKNWRRTLEE